MSEGVLGTVYLLHFREPYKHARHYIGWAHAHNVTARIDHHRHGTGARLPGVVAALGIELIVARLWEGVDRNYERRLKNQKNTPRLCPLCTPPKIETTPEVIQGTCANCERCTWNPGPDCGVKDHPHCPTCGHCEGRHYPLTYGEAIQIIEIGGVQTPYDPETIQDRKARH